MEQIPKKGKSEKTNKERHDEIISMEKMEQRERRLVEEDLVELNKENKEFEFEFNSLIQMQQYFGNNIIIDDMKYKREGNVHEGEIGIPYYTLEKNPKTEKIVKEMLDKRQKRKQENKEKVIEYEIIEDTVLKNGETRQRNLKGFISLEFANKYIEKHEKELKEDALKVYPDHISSKLRVVPKEIWIDKQYSSPEEEAFVKKIKDLGYEPVGYGIPVPGYQDINDPHYSNPDGSTIYDGQSVYVNDEGQYADAWYFRDLLGYNLSKE